MTVAAFRTVSALDIGSIDIGAFGKINTDNTDGCSTEAEFVEQIGVRSKPYGFGGLQPEAERGHGLAGRVNYLYLSLFLITMKLNLDPKLSVEQNAQVYFEKAKKARKKLEGARKALAVSLRKLEQEEQDKDDKLEKLRTEQKRQEQKKRRRHEWYEKFRWFFSSEGFLVIGGRDATTNEIVIKKHTDQHDVVFHTDMAGSPFFVIKTDGKDPGEATLQEAADATLCFSRAWRMGLGTTPTFWVAPEQVTKEANTGEYLPKGAFMIRGKTHYVNVTPNCAVGALEDGRIMCAPTSAVKHHCREFIELVQGKTKPSDIAKLIKRKFGGELDEIIKVLPSGGTDIKE